MYTLRVIWTLTVGTSETLKPNAVGIGIVLQKSQSDKRKKPGPIFEVIAERHGPSTSMSPDARAIIRALELAASRGYERIRIRSVNNGLRKALRDLYQKPADPGPQDPVLRQILGLARTFQLVDFAWIPGRKNAFARTLAREGRLLVDSSTASRTSEPWLVRPRREPPDTDCYFEVDDEDHFIALGIQDLDDAMELDDDDDDVSMTRSSR